MTPDEFNHSVRTAHEPPAPWPAALRALWWMAKGDWGRAHGIAQGDASAEGSWVHAHLHRVEGDEANAGYWYARAGRPHADAPLEHERAAIVAALLDEA